MGWLRRSPDGRGHMKSICVADSLCCAVEMNTTLLNNYTPVTINEKKNPSNRKKSHGIGCVCWYFEDIKSSYLKLCKACLVHIVLLWKWSESVGHSVMSASLWTCVTTRLLCPWHSPGKNTGVNCHPISRGFSLPKDETRVSCIAGRLFSLWATRKTLHFTLFYL